MKGPSGKSPADRRISGRVLGEALRERGLTLAVAESCTGGLLSAMITDIPGSSEYFTGGVVAYANDVKRKLLGVGAETLKGYGAVSSQVAGEMAEGVRERLKADAGVSITGIAGPGGGSAKKPVGTVFIAVSCGGRTKVKRFFFEGSRKAVRRSAALAAMEETLLLLGAGKA